MKTLYKMAVILLVVVVSGCAGIPRGGYGQGYYGNQGYGYQQGYNGSKYNTPQEYYRGRETQLGPYGYPGGEYDRHLCTQTGQNCLQRAW